MSWIREIDVDEAEEDLKEIYDELAESRGKVSNILKVHSLNPDAMRAHLDLYMSVMFKNTNLNRKECEMIAVVVSAANECEYCVRHHMEALNHYWRDEKKVERLAVDYSDLNIDEKKMRMLEFSKKLTLEPNNIEKKYFDEIKDCGFEDQELLDIVLVVSYFNFVNRIALGLGVEVDENEVGGYDY